MVVVVEVGGGIVSFTARLQSSTELPGCQSFSWCMSRLISVSPFFRQGDVDGSKMQNGCFTITGFLVRRPANGEMA